MGSTWGIGAFAREGSNNGLVSLAVVVTWDVLFLLRRSFREVALNPNVCRNRCLMTQSDVQEGTIDHVGDGRSKPICCCTSMAAAEAEGLALVELFPA